MSGKVRYRNMREDDIDDILTLEAASFPSIPSDRYWKPDQILAHIQRFPEGQFVADLDGRILGSATTMRVPLDRALARHTWREMAGGGYLTTHEPEGNAVYGTEIMVHPDARRRGIGKALYRLRKDLCRRLNVRAFVTGGRIPGYDKHADKMSAGEYVQRVMDLQMSDRTLTAQISSGMTVAGILPGYITDPSSRNHATLLVWWNLAYEWPE